MKRTSQFSLLTAVVFTAGSTAPVVQAQPTVLGHEMFVQMDSNQDGKVSRVEYIDYGTAYLGKKGKQCNPGKMEIRFAGFDRNGDGYITAEDPDAVLLSREARPEPLTSAAEKEPVTPPAKSVEQAMQVHRGIVIAKVKVKKESDKTKETSEQVKRAKTVVTTTTQRIEEETQHLSISVANTGPKRDMFKLCWYFLCRPQDGGAIRIYDKGSKAISLSSRERVSHTVVAKKISVVEQTVERENEDNGRCSDPVESVRGDKAKGYLVLLKHGDTILDKKSSSKEFLNEQWLSRL